MTYKQITNLCRLVGRGFGPVTMGLRPTNRHETDGDAPNRRVLQTPCNAPDRRISLNRCFKGAAGLLPGVARVRTPIGLRLETSAGRPAAGLKLLPTFDIGALILLAALIPASLFAQGPPGGRGGPPPVPKTAKEAAPVDLTGYWVSVVTEDWRWRMVTPIKGDFAGVPLNPAGRKLGLTWDPAKDEAAGEQCRAYAAPAIMRVPGRVHITWQDDNTLKIETDAGTQTRLLHFTGKPPVAGESPEAGKPSWQGYSQANWETPVRGEGLPLAGLGAVREGTKGRSLEVVTTQLRPGYLRKNGAPYSANAVVNEFYDLSKEPNGDIWFHVTTIVKDPQFLDEPFVTSTDFRKQPDAAGWNPSPCTSR